MAADKKDYIDTIEALTLTATITSIRNKLNKVRARTEDQKLIDFLDTAIHRLDASGSRAIASLNLAHAEYGNLHKYCKAVVDAIKPQWQILAERNGWGPKNEND